MANGNERSIILPKEPTERRAIRVQRIATYLAGLDPEKAWDLIVRPFKRSRSNQQNRYLRGVAAQMLADEWGFETEDMYEWLLGRYYGWKQKRVPKTPSNPKGIEDVPRRRTTTDENGRRDVLSTRDFWDFVEFVQRFGAQHGVFIPDPDPEYFRRPERQRNAA